MLFGIYTIASSAKSNINRLFLVLTSSMAIWSFAYSLSHSATTEAASAFWRSFSVFGWGVFYSLLLHFILILTRNKLLLNKRSSLILLYLPAFINILLFSPFGFLTATQFKMVQTEFGWINTAPIDIGGIWLNLYYIIFSSTAIILLIRWWRKLKPHTPLKRQVTNFVISILIPFFIGIATDILPDMLGPRVFPKCAIVFMIIPTITIFLALKRFGLLLERKREISLFPEVDKSIDEERLRLFQMSAAVFVVGAVLYFLLGYFGMKIPLEHTIITTIVILLIGILTLLIPHVIRSHAAQNIVFLAVCSVGILFFIIINADIGAVTIWAIYVIFFLATVILGNNLHAAIFTAWCVVVQVILWIIRPEVIVSIDTIEYLTRVVIIMLAYFTVRYMANEYTAKMKGYQRFVKEHEALEKISSSFISATNENAIEKIGEMLKLSVETLELDQAYLVDFSRDYEDATVLSAHTRVGVVESIPFRPGMKVKTAALPVAKSLLAQKQPIACEDITIISTDEGEEERDFFASRGINSYFALPIIIDENVIGMLVVEHYKRIDINTRENQIYFLNIVANMLSDTRKNSLYEEQLYNVAYFDEDTKLANRNMLIQMLEQKIHNREESERIAVLDIEIDNLRMIKDTFGHRVGEQIVIKAAKIIEELLEQCCDISRAAEGEFIVILPTVEDTSYIEKCAQRLVDSFTRPILTGAGIEALFAVIHIGVSIHPDHGRDAYTLLKNADLAGFQAKSMNKKVVFYTQQLEDHIAENTLFTNRLFQSLQNEEFSLEFQPQVSCDTGKTVGVEALLRWTIDGNKRIPPDKFIYILEQTGLIYDVGLWVLEQALQEHNRLVLKGFPPLRFSVNLSIVQFHIEDFIVDFVKIIEKSRVDPKYIELEITESLFSENPEEVITKLHKLRELGLNIALDDFGKGYSSLHRLEVIPFDRIKIDKSIIDDINVRGKKAVIAETIVSLAKTLRADITAEGVETKEQVDFLRDLACDEIQGYYFSRPLSAEALEEFLDKEGCRRLD